MKRLFQIFIISVLLIGIGSSSYASALITRGNFHVIPMNKWWELPSIASKLNLMDKEKDSLNNLLLKTRLKLIDLNAEIKKGKSRLENMLEQKKLDESALMKELENFQKARLEFFKVKFQYILGVRKILGFKRFETLKEALIKFRIKNRIFKSKKKLGHHRHQGKWIK